VLRENQAGRRTGRARPVLFLLLASPLIAELAWGTTTISQAPGLLFQIGLYGCGAIVIREAVIRWGGGWPSVLLLGLAYGAIEEGLLEPTWLTPRLFPHPYGVAGGVYWTYAVFNAGYHAIFSIGIPVALTEILFPSWRGRPWLHRPGLAVAGAVYIVNAAAIGVAWYTVLQKSAFGIPARVHPVQMAGVAVLVAALIAAARLAASRRAAGLLTPEPLAPRQRIAVSGESDPGPAAGARRAVPGLGALPGPRPLGCIAAAAALLWFAILLVATSQDALSWLPFVVPLIIIAAAVAGAVQWVMHRPPPSARQLLAACAGALVVQAAAGFVATGVHGPVNIAGKAILNVAELIVLTVLYRRLPADDPRDSFATAGACPGAGAGSSADPELADSAANGGPGAAGTPQADASS
jgi:hypothetical protein